MVDVLFSLDASLRQWLATHHHPVLDAAMAALSTAGRAGAIWFILGIGLASRRRDRVAGVFRMGLALGLAYLLTDGVIKPLVGRDRPFVAVMDTRVVGSPPATFSFPSGHAASSFAGAFALSRIWGRGRLALWLLATLVALSRIYVGVHYPLDVVAGALLGLASAYVALGTARREDDARWLGGRV